MMPETDAAPAGSASADASPADAGVEMDIRHMDGGGGDVSVGPVLDSAEGQTDHRVCKISQRENVDKSASSTLSGSVTGGRSGTDEAARG